MTLINNTTRRLHELTRTRKIIKCGEWFKYEDEGDGGINRYIRDNENDILGWHNGMFTRLPLKSKRRRVALDLGGCYGMAAIPLSTFFDEVHSFEINPNMEPVLRANTERFENIKVHMMGASDADGVRYLHENPTSSGGSYVTHGDDTPPRNKIVGVGVTSIDSFDFQNVDFIKFDVEGHELEAINGAINTIRRYRPMLVVEMHPRSPTFSYVLMLLMLENYVLIEKCRGGDYVFLHRYSGDVESYWTTDLIGFPQWMPK